MEVFAGCARLTGACSELGISCGAPIELLRGGWCDLTLPQVQRLLLQWIQEGRVAGIWLGTPCKFWSIAKNNKQGEGAHISRQLARFTARIITTCQQYCVCYVLDNPASGRLFEWDLICTAPRRSKATQVTLHMCAYGTSYMKPTRLAGTLPGLADLGRRCSCDVPHERLCGLVQVRTPAGLATVWKTSLAGKYPPRLCRAIAALVKTHLHGASSLAPTRISQWWDQQLVVAHGGWGSLVAPPVDTPICPARWRCEWASSPSFAMCGVSRQRRKDALAAKRTRSRDRARP